MNSIIKIHNFNGYAATVEIDEANGAIKISGTTDGTTTNKLVDSGGGFTSAVDVGDAVYNSTDDTHAYVTAVDSDTILALSADIFITGEDYEIQGEITHNITESDMGSTDAADINPVTYPIIAGENSFHKYQTIHITAMGGSSAIDNFKIWRTTALSANTTHLSNARETSYDQKPYVAPSTSATAQADQTMPSSEPSGANLGIDGTLSGSRTATGHSDFLVHQIQTTGSAIIGATCTMNYQYDETA